jgi:hypothetical protein
MIGYTSTYHFLGFTAVISLLKNSKVEIVEIELPLQGQLMIGIEDIERERGPWSVERSWVPCFAKKLLVSFQMAALAASTIQEFEAVDAIHVHNNERFVEDLWSGAWSVRVTYINNHSEVC